MLVLSRFRNLKWLLFVSIGLLTTNEAVFADQPKLLLADDYHNHIDLNDYWISEKYDGYRAYWNGHQLVSRQGLVFNAPAWFVKDFPELPMDGELWTGRNQFERLASIVRRKQPHSEWQQVSFMVFDLPSSKEIFDLRLQQLDRIVADSASPYLKPVVQFKLESHDALIEELHKRVEDGAEGLMLHRGDSLYRSGRNDDLLKLKPLQDMEAKVLEHLPGKGRHKNRMGSLLVETPSGIRFRLGTGFTDAERDSPPALGAIVTFQYSGLTSRGVPRFARYLRVREDRTWEHLKDTVHP